MGFPLFFLSVRKLNLLPSTDEDPAFYVVPVGLMGVQKYYIEIAFYF